MDYTTQQYTVYRIKQLKLAADLHKQRPSTRRLAMAAR